jgi:hypothetical protein
VSKLKEDVKKTAVVENSNAKSFSAGYGGKFGVQTDRVDKVNTFKDIKKIEFIFIII